MSKFKERCFLLVDQKKNVLCIPCNYRVLHQIVQEGYPLLSYSTLKELDQTIHEYVKTNFKERCFLLVDQKKNVLCIPCNDRVLHQIVHEGYPLLSYSTLKELDQTIHEYVKTNFSEELHKEDMTDADY